MTGGRSGSSSLNSSERHLPRKTQGRITGRAVTNALPSPAGGVKLETLIPWTLVKRGVKQQIITPLDAPEAFRVEVAAARAVVEREAPELRALGLAHYWQHLLDTGRFGSLTAIAAAEGLDLGQVSRIARMAWVGPWVVGACWAGETEKATLEAFCRCEVDMAWRVPSTREVGPPP